MEANNTSRPSAAEAKKLTTGQWIILAVVLLADILDLMDSTITQIAAPSIVRSIGGGDTVIKWLGAGYALAMGALLVVGGRLGDRFGKRRMFLIGIAGFTLASLWCGLSPDPTVIIIGRVLQGAFGALLLPQGLSILMASVSREQFPTVTSAFGPSMGLSAILGPILAGAIISLNLFGLGWRPVFLINIALGSAGFILGLRYLPRDEANPNEGLDILGTGLLTLSLFLLFLGLISGPSGNWQPSSLATIAAGVVVMGGFVVRQMRASTPLIRPSLFRNRGFVSGTLMGLGFFAAVNGFTYVLALFFQQVLGLAPITASLGLAPLMGGIIAASFVGRPLIERWGRKLILAGLLTVVLGALVLSATIYLSGGDVKPVALTPALFILGAGMGACFGSIFDVAIGDVAPEEAGSASGGLSAIQQFANALGAAVVTTIYFSSLAAVHGLQGLQTTTVVMAGLVVLCLGLVPLLPSKVV